MPQNEFSATKLNHLRRQLNAWRRSQRGRTRLPEEVWESATSLARTHGVAAPITEHVAKVVNEGMTVQEMALSLLATDPKHEWDQVV